MIKKFIYNETVSIHIVAITIMLFVARMAFPYLIYPFAFFFISFVLISSLNIKKMFSIARLILIFKKFWPFWIIVLFYIIGIAETGKLYQINIKDLFNIGITIVFIFLLNIIIDNHKTFEKLKNIFLQYLIYSSLIIGLFGLIHYYLLLINIQIPFFKTPLTHINGVSLVSDNNFYALYIILGLLAIMQKIYNSDYRKIFGLIVFVLVTNIIFSDSHRSHIVLLLIIIASIIAYIYLSFKKKHVKYLNNFICQLIISNLIWIVIFYIFFVAISGNSRNKTLNALNINSVKFKIEVTYLYKDFMSSINYHLPYTYTYNKLWQMKNDFKDPDSGWGTSYHKTVFPITGKGSELIPLDVKGYRLDKNTNTNTWTGNAYSFTKIIDTIGKKSIEYHSQVYCYVSNNFDGQWAKLSVEGNILGKKVSVYDMTKKGTWQKLELQFTDKSEDPFKIYLYVAKYYCTNFSKLKGYVIFAYPQFNSIDIKILNSHEQKDVSSFPLYPLNFIKGSIISVLNGIKSYTKKESEHRYTNNVSISRINRWKYAYEIFFQQYSLKNRIFGAGFNYLKLFGHKFYKDDPQKTDYPHNIIISSFLYSGIIGGFFHLLFLLLLFIKYFIKTKYPLPFILIIFSVFFFSMISGNSFFSIPVFIVFSSFPFIEDFYLKDLKKGLVLKKTD